MPTRKGTMLAYLIAAVMISGLIGFAGVASSAGPLPMERKNDQLRIDETIRSKIEKRLFLDDRIDWELLQVEVYQGHATLYGEVRTPEEKGLAALLASTVPGVNDLTNSIIVEPAATPDHKLTKTIWSIFRSVPTLSDNDTLRVKVKNTVVKLEGSVEEPVQKEAAEKAAASVPGVTTVINLIEVKRMVSGENITEKVRAKMLHEGVEVLP